MRRSRGRVVGLTAVTASLLIPVSPAVAAAPANAIGSVQVACAQDQSGAGYYQVTVGFTHRGPLEVRVYGLDNGQYYDSDHLWFRGSGAETWVGAIYARTPAVSTHLLKIQRPSNNLVDVVTPVTTQVTCS